MMYPQYVKTIGSTTERLLIAALLLLIMFITTLLGIPQMTVLASNREDVNNQILGVYTSIDYAQPVATQSRFISKVITQEKKIPYETVFKDNPEKEYGEEEVLQEGKDGKNTKLIKITYAKPDNSSDKYLEEEFEREILKDETIPPIEKIISKGTKIVWRTLETPEGTISYWRKMRVYATHYDKYCRGCDEWTAIGMRAGKGVIAVDPKVIKMRSQVYVPGYGKAIAGDTGGAIKGNIIDLGYDDARTAGWSARYVDIYLLDKAPY